MTETTTIRPTIAEEPPDGATVLLTWDPDDNPTNAEVYVRDDAAARSSAKEPAQRWFRIGQDDYPYSWLTLSNWQARSPAATLIRLYRESEVTR